MLTSCKKAASYGGFKCLRPEGVRTQVIAVQTLVEERYSHKGYLSAHRQRCHYGRRARAPVIGSMPLTCRVTVAPGLLWAGSVPHGGEGVRAGARAKHHSWHGSLAGLQ